MVEFKMSRCDHISEKLVYRLWRWHFKWHFEYCILYIVIYAGQTGDLNETSATR